jgi:hypothetical protein
MQEVKNPHIENDQNQKCVSRGGKAGGISGWNRFSTLMKKNKQETQRVHLVFDVDEEK